MTLYIYFDSKNVLKKEMPIDIAEGISKPTFALTLVRKVYETHLLFTWSGKLYRKREEAKTTIFEEYNPTTNVFISCVSPSLPDRLPYPVMSEIIGIFEAHLEIAPIRSRGIEKKEGLKENLFELLNKKQLLNKANWTWLMENNALHAVVIALDEQLLTRERLAWIKNNIHLQGVNGLIYLFLRHKLLTTLNPHQECCNLDFVMTLSEEQRCLFLEILAIYERFRQVNRRFVDELLHHEEPMLLLKVLQHFNAAGYLTAEVIGVLHKDHIVLSSLLVTLQLLEKLGERNETHLKYITQGQYPSEVHDMMVFFQDNNELFCPEAIQAFFSHAHPPVMLRSSIILKQTGYLSLPLWMRVARHKNPVGILTQLELLTSAPFDPIVLDELGDPNLVSAALVKQICAKNAICIEQAELKALLTHPRPTSLLGVVRWADMRGYLNATHFASIRSRNNLGIVLVTIQEEEKKADRTLTEAEFLQCLGPEPRCPSVGRLSMLPRPKEKPEQLSSMKRVSFCLPPT